MASTPAAARPELDESDHDSTLLKEAARLARMGAWHYDVAARRLRWSDGAAAIYELPPGNRPDLELALGHYDEASRPLIAAAVDAALTHGKPFDLELGLVTARGRRRRVRAFGDAHWQDGRVVRIGGMLQDITDRVQASPAIADLSDRLCLATEAAGVGVWQWMIEPRSVTWNDQMYRLYGLPVAPDGAMSASRWHKLVHPEDRDRISNDVDQVARERRSGFEHEFRIVRPDGEVRHVLSVGRLATRHAGGRRMTGIQIDITDRKRHAQAMADKQAAEQASRAKSEFLSRVSHQLRTPMNAILGFARLLHQRADELPGWAERPLRQICHGGEHVLALVNDMLDLSSIETGRTSVWVTAVSLDEAVREAMALSDPLAKERGVQLRLLAAPVPRPVRSDRTRLMQVLLNLLSNAIKRSDAGSRVTLRVRNDPAQRACELEVSDAGTVAGGSGLGLAISRQLAEAMGGSLRTRLQSAGGSRATLRLPMAEPDAAATPPAAQPSTDEAPAAVQGGRVPVQVLYVEDNATNAMLVREALAPHRGRIALEVAPDGEQAWDRLQRQRPDVALIDINLPGMDGHELVRRVRGHPGLAGLPCVAVSADAMPHEVERALREGFDDYWTKPLDIVRLPQRILDVAGATDGGRAAP